MGAQQKSHHHPQPGKQTGASSSLRRLLFFLSALGDGEFTSSSSQTFKLIATQLLVAHLIAFADSLSTDTLDLGPGRRVSNSILALIEVKTCPSFLPILAYPRKSNPICSTTPRHTLCSNRACTSSGCDTRQRALDTDQHILR